MGFARPGFQPELQLKIMKQKNRFPCAGVRALWAPTRRDFVYGLGASLGSVALTSLLADEAERDGRADPMAPKDGHLPAKAKRCIFLMM